MEKRSGTTTIRNCGGLYKYSTTRKALAATECGITASRFPKRRPSIATIVARAVDRYRVLALNEESLKTYFDDLEDHTRRNEIRLDDMWDFDEKGFLMGAGGEGNGLEEARSQINALGSVAQKLEADLAVAKAERHPRKAC